MTKCIFCERSIDPNAVQCPHCGAALTPTEAASSPGSRYPANRPDDSSWHAEVVSLVSQGRQFEAIKVYRARTGAGLSEAQAAVTGLTLGEPIADHAARVSQGTSAEADLLDLLRQGQKIQAIKVYRERTGAGLRDAKEAVERLAAQHDIATGRAGCFGVLALGVAIGGMAWNWI